jgi:hypothetical protein
MAKSSTKFGQQPHEALDLLPKRTWHVVTGSGADATIKAHHCDHLDGVLSFSDYTRPDDDPNYVLVRAFAPGQWADVELVDVSMITDTHGGFSERHHQ